MSNIKVIIYRVPNLAEPFGGGFYGSPVSVRHCSERTPHIILPPFTCWYRFSGYMCADFSNRTHFIEIQYFLTFISNGKCWWKLIEYWQFRVFSMPAIRGTGRLWKIYEGISERNKFLWFSEEKPIIDRFELSGIKA